MKTSARVPFAPTDEMPIRDVRGDWVSSEEAARIAGCSGSTIRQAAKARVLSHVVMGSERKPEYKFERQVAEEFGRARRVRKVLNSRGERSFDLLIDLLAAGESLELPSGSLF